MTRPSWSYLFLVAAAGALAAFVHTAVFALLSGDNSGFFALFALIASGMGAFGASVGFVAGQITPLGRFARIAITAIVTFVATFVVSLLPGILGGLERAIFVTVAVIGVLAIMEWERSRTSS